MKLALDNDPVSLAINLAQGFPYYYDGEYDEAIAAYKKALELDPTSDHAHARLYHAYVQKRMYDEAIAEFVACYSYWPELQQRIKALYAASGITGFWEAQVSVPEEKVARCTMYSMAQDHALAGARDKAFRWLERCYDRRESLTALKVIPTSTTCVLIRDSPTSCCACGWSHDSPRLVNGEQPEKRPEAGLLLEDGSRKVCLRNKRAAHRVCQPLRALLSVVSFIEREYDK